MTVCLDDLSLVAAMFCCKKLVTTCDKPPRTTCYIAQHWQPVLIATHVCGDLTVQQYKSIRLQALHQLSKWQHICVTHIIWNWVHVI